MPPFFRANNAATLDAGQPRANRFTQRLLRFRSERAFIDPLQRRDGDILHEVVHVLASDPAVQRKPAGEAELTTISPEKLVSASATENAFT